MQNHIDIVFDGPPGNTAGRFVELEDSTGKSISFGEWVECDDGMWALRIPDFRAETMEAFIAWTNTDLTEGRGQSLPLAVCELESTAHRLGKGKYVQGGHCPVDKVTLLKLRDGYSWGWWGPVHLIKPTDDDKAKEKVRAAKETAVKKAMDAGLSQADINAIQAADSGRPKS